jgi:RNA:NAD 2'-phosphotransferase (TPT1/KptA family)
VVLHVHAGEASRRGVRFWRGNEMTWLAEGVPPEYLTGLDREEVRRAGRPDGQSS